jgi:DNA-binding MarR family transcriptional regulator
MSKPHEKRKALTQALDQTLEFVVLLNDDMQRDLARHGLSVSRAHLLWLLHHSGPMTQRTLADALKVSPRNVTGLVDGLAATGFVTREPHPDDRRATLVSLTERGASTMAEMDARHRDLALSLFGDMPREQLAGFLAGLDHVKDRLRYELRAASGEGGG